MVAPRPPLPLLLLRAGAWIVVSVPPETFWVETTGAKSSTASLTESAAVVTAGSEEKGVLRRSMGFRARGESAILNTESRSARRFARVVGVDPTHNQLDDIGGRLRMASRIIRLPAVLDLTGLSRSTIYLRMANEEFPSSISLDGRAVGWVETEVSAWIDRQIEVSRT